MEAADVLRRLAEPRLRLELHPVGLPVQVEVVDVERGQKRLERLVQVREGNPQRFHLLPVHLDEQLRHVHPNVRGHAPQVGQRVRVARETAREPGEPLDVVHGPVLKVHLEARRRAEPRDLREIEGERPRLLQAEQIAVHGAQHRVELVLPGGPFVPGLQGDEDRGGVRLVRVLDEVQSDQRDGVPDRRLSLQERLNVLHDRVGTLARRGVRQLDEDREVALVLGRNEPARHDAHEHEQQGDDDPEAGEEGPGPVDHQAGRPEIALGHRLEAPVEPSEEPAQRRPGLAPGVGTNPGRKPGVTGGGLEQHRAQRRGQRQRHDA